MIRRRSGPPRGGLAPEQRRQPEQETGGRDVLKAMKRDWRRAVIRGGCVMCRHDPVDQTIRDAYRADLGHFEPHHVLPKRFIKPEALRWDETLGGLPLGANGVCLCRYHHERHTNRVERMPSALVPNGAREFAKALGLVPELEREYGEVT